jgi:hypothetical protein
VAALDEAAPDLEPDARAAYDRYRERLLLALFQLSGEDTLCLALQELDSAQILHDFLLPLLRFGMRQGWEMRLHFDRGAREPGAWPALKDRRWGPPIDAAEYLRKELSSRPSDGVLVRVRGTGAAALLSFYVGRLRYPTSTGVGELWARALLPRYELTEEDWQGARLSPVIDRNVGKKQRLAYSAVPGEEEIPGVEPEQALESFASLVFTAALVKAQGGEPFLPREG